jgi:uncharacterized protein (DUF488 family)
MKKIFTIGHSSRSFEELLRMLKESDINALVDVRRFPGSAKYPHFNHDHLKKELDFHHVQYFHLLELGGRRKPLAHSRNLNWKNDAFRGYADHMETDDFGVGISRLMHISSRFTTAMMCSEAVWWQCHRALISDMLKSLDYQVLHIMGIGKVQEHPYTNAARIINNKLSYGLDE